MNKDLLKLFFVAVLSFPVLGKQNSDDSKYIDLLPKGKIREYCANNPENTDSCFFAKVIWSAVNEKKYNSMSKAEQFAYKSVTRFWLRERTNNKDSLSLYNWKKNDYRLLTTAAFEVTLKMKLSAEQVHKEVANVIEMCIKLEQELEKTTKEESKKGTNPPDR